MSPADPNRLYAATETAVLESTNGGADWTDLGAPFAAYSLLVDPASSALWVGTDAGGLYRYVAP
jgi:hypothetical protein